MSHPKTDGASVTDIVVVSIRLLPGVRSCIKTTALQTLTTGKAWRETYKLAHGDQTAPTIG